MNRLRFRMMRGILLILGASILLISSHGLQDQMSVAKKPVPEPEPPLPQAPMLILQERNLVTAEPRHAMEVWDTAGSGPFWQAQGTRYDSVAVGDVDGDGIREVVGSAGCNLKRSTLNFINVFKEDVDVSGYEMGVWRSTYYDESQNLEEVGNVVYNEVALADLDGDEDDEIVIITRRWLAVYDFDSSAPYTYKTPDGLWAQDTGAVIKQAEIKPVIPGDRAEMQVRSLKLCDFNGDGNIEILVVGWDYSRDLSCLFIYTFSGTQLILDDYLLYSGVPSTKTLAAGNLDSDPELELCTTGYRRWRVRNKNYYQGYLFIWDYTNAGWVLDEIPIDVEKREPTYQMLDVGQLDQDPEDEIVLAARVYGEPMLMGIYNWNSTQGLVPTGNSVFLESEISPHDILIADLEDDGTNEIVLGGYYSNDNPDTGILYLEIFDGSLLSIWYRKGGNSEQSTVRYLAVG